MTTVSGSPKVGLMEWQLPITSYWTFHHLCDVLTGAINSLGFIVNTEVSSCLPHKSTFLSHLHLRDMLIAQTAIF